MSSINDIELQSRSGYFTATYITDDSTCYDIVFCRLEERNLGWESVELVNVQERGEDIRESDSLWNEIEKLLGEISMDQPHDDVCCFSILISRDWLDALNSLSENVLAGSRSTPEEMVETALFSQIQEQLHP